MPKLNVSLNDLVQKVAPYGGTAQQRSDGARTWYVVFLKGDEYHFEKRTTAMTFIEGWLKGYEVGSADHAGPMPASVAEPV